jgi:hypothetical protein
MRLHFCIGGLRRGVLGLLIGSAMFMLVVASSAADINGSTTCTGTLAGTINGNITVPAGATCTIRAATVNGNIGLDGVSSNLNIVGDVTVNGNITSPPNADVVIDSPAPLGPNTINGNISSAELICGATVNGNVSMSGNAVEVALGGTEPAAACQLIGGGNKISGNVTIANNSPMFFRVADNRINGNVTIVHTTGSATKRILNNSINGILSCEANDPPLQVSGNSASVATGQCAP